MYFDGRWPIGYSLSGPVEGLSGPRQYPFTSATGRSSRKYRCNFNCPSINLTCTIISVISSPRFRAHPDKLVKQVGSAGRRYRGIPLRQ